jgi:hypothetical protein
MLIYSDNNDFLFYSDFTFPIKSNDNDNLTAGKFLDYFI